MHSIIVNLVAILISAKKLSLSCFAKDVLVQALRFPSIPFSAVSCAPAPTRVSSSFSTAECRGRCAGGRFQRAQLWQDQQC